MEQGQERERTPSSETPDATPAKSPLKLLIGLAVVLVAVIVIEALQPR